MNILNGLIYVGITLLAVLIFSIHFWIAVEISKATEGGIATLYFFGIPLIVFVFCIGAFR